MKDHNNKRVEVAAKAQKLPLQMYLFMMWGFNLVLLAVFLMA